MKRSDLTSAEVLETVTRAGFQAYERLAESYPSKVVLAAFEREVNAGRLDYGVSLARPWVREPTQ